MVRCLTKKILFNPHYFGFEKEIAPIDWCLLSLQFVFKKMDMIACISFQAKAENRKKRLTCDRENTRRNGYVRHYGMGGLEAGFE